MAGFNQQILIGNLGQDVEVRYTQGGTAVANLRVAVNERVKKGDNWVDHTEWFTVVVFGKQAENAGKYLAKGRQVHVVGRSRFKEYQKNDGGKGYSREIVVGPGGLTFLGGGQGQGQGGQRSSNNGQRANNDDGFYGDQGAGSGGDTGMLDDDLPF